MFIRFFASNTNGSNNSIVNSSIVNSPIINSSAIVKKKVQEFSDILSDPLPKKEKIFKLIIENLVIFINFAGILVGIFSFSTIFFEKNKKFSTKILELGVLFFGLLISILCFGPVLYNLNFKFFRIFSFLLAFYNIILFVFISKNEFAIKFSSVSTLVNYEKFLELKKLNSKNPQNSKNNSTDINSDKIYDIVYEIFEKIKFHLIKYLAIFIIINLFLWFLASFRNRFINFLIVVIFIVSCISASFIIYNFHLSKKTAEKSSFKNIEINAFTEKCLVLI